MEHLLKKQLREHINRFELFGSRSDLIMAHMIINLLINIDNLNDIDDSDVNIDY